MNEGNWVPVDKRLKYFLPLKREYSKVEAAFSLQLDYDSGKSVSAAGYSKLWGWSRSKVGKFLEGMDAEILSSNSSPNGGVISIKQKGQAEDRLRTGRRQAQLKDNNKLESKKGRTGTGQGQAKDTTIDTDTKKDIKTPLEIAFDFEANFNIAWKAYPKKDGRKKAREHYRAQIKNEATAAKFIAALNNYLVYVSREQIAHQYIKNGSTFFNNWEDWETMPQQTTSSIPNQTSIFLPDGKVRFVS